MIRKNGGGVSKKKRKRNVVTIEQKFQAIQRLEKGELQRIIADEYGVSRNTISDWYRDRRKIQQSYIFYSEGASSKKSAKTTPYPKTSEALYVWFGMKRCSGVPLSGPFLQQKAMLLSKEFPDEAETFTASEGWLSRWKRRYGIRELTICGESLSADAAGARACSKEIQSLILSRDYSLDQVFNADETGLNFRMMPEKTLAFKTERSAPGLKKSKERVTVMACANASGSCKLPLMIIGKSARPRCLKGIDHAALPVYYRGQKSAWMSGDLFISWFHEEFVPKVKAFLKENGLSQKALLLLDNAPSHPPLKTLKSKGIEVRFLAPRTTSLIQPMDQGIIITWKRFYRKSLLQEILINSDDIDHLINSLKKISMKDVIYWSAEAWERVRPSTLRQAWSNILNATFHHDEPENRIDDKIFEKLFQKLPGCEDLTIDDVGEWVSRDDEVQLTDAEIAECVLGEEKDEEGEEEVDREIETISYDDAFQALETSLKFVESQAGITPQDILVFRKWRSFAAEKRVNNEKKRQTTINTFFRPR